MSMNDLVLKVNDVLTGSVLIIALVGIGLLFTFKLGFIQIRGFKDGWNRTFGGLFSKKGDAGKDGMSSFQALATAIAAQVGTVISPELQLQLQSVVREQSSGCGSAHSSECQRSSQKRLWLRSSSRSVMTEP